MRGVDVMGARNDNYKKRGTSYIDGNAARQLNAVPDIRRERQVAPPPPQRKKRTAPKEKGIDFKALLVLTLAIAFTLYACVQYLNIHSNMLSLEKNIVSLEKELETIKKVNVSSLESVYNGLDLEYVYEQAVGKLGMVHPNNNKVIFYEKGEEDYVRQYKDIPDSEEKGILDKLMALKK